jgi:hypothetical protein
MKAVSWLGKRAINAIALLWCGALSASAETCALAVSHPQVNFGHTQRAQLLEGTRQGQHWLVGARVITLNLNCVASTAMALSFNGERADDHSYRFAHDGKFTLTILSAELDGQSVRLMVQDAAGCVKNPDIQLRPGTRLVPGDLGRSARGSKFSAQVEVKAYVDERDTQARSREQWEGGGYFSFDTF